jgi:uncharacterized repeat protein (TIGR03806 family)
MRSIVRLFLLLIVICSITSRVSADTPYGLDNRVPIAPFLNTNLPPASASSYTEWSTVPAFPNLRFQDPTFLIPEPGTNRLYVGGRQGMIWFFNNDSNTTVKTEFLNLTDRNQGYDDCGLLGMAFHPEFGQPASTNRGYVYVWYQYSPAPTNPSPARLDWTVPTYNRLSRFTVPDGSLVADPNSELVLINQFKQQVWHNGGGMFFGSDGFLYVSNGDEGGSDDIYQNTQRLNKGLFSGVLRIDVNQDETKSHPIRRQPLSGGTPPAGWPSNYSANYYIPNDNPFVNPDGSVLEEFYAIGFRSPHRMTFDPPTGQIWVGDVGDSAREEVDLIVKGGNYQWAYYEGNLFPGPNAKPQNLIGTDQPPVYDYPHWDENGNSTGNSCIIGGYVYRGPQFSSELGGKLIFGDNFSGRIWSLTYNGTNPPAVTYLCNMPPGLLYEGLSSFGIDQNNELYMCQMGSNGQIWKLAHNDTPLPEPPQLLSQVGVFANITNLSTIPGIIPYNVNSPLWSDGAVKSRWMAVPNAGTLPYSDEEQIGFAPTGEWTFPVGTVLIKHFELPVDDTNPAVRKRLETRLLVHGTNGTYYGLTYKWRADNSDADLLTNSLNEDILIATTNGYRTQTWYYPSRQDCLICHNPNAHFVLGPKTRQLNGDFTYPDTGITDNQLRTLNHLGMFNPSLDETNIPTYASTVHVTNTTASLDNRMRSYIDANCAHCHRPGSGVQATFDARFDTPLANQNIVNGPVGNSLGITNAHVITPGDVSKSIMHVRLNTVGPNRMPPIAKNVIDQEAVATLQAWINSFVPPAITTQPESQSANPGDVVVLEVTATGSGSLSYQWQQDGVNIPGATNSSYLIPDAEPGDAGTYAVVVSNVAGTVTSSNALLTINGPPIITGQPSGQSVTLGDATVFSVSSSGTAPLSYQWRFNGTNIEGATTSSYSITNAQLSDAGNYSVLVTNLIGSDLSSNAFLDVTIPLPTAWLGGDIGETFVPGYFGITNGVFTINASGGDIWSSSDAFHFVYQTLTGDGSIVARVAGIEDTDDWAKSGVMIRETLDANSAHAFMAITYNNGTSFQFRTVKGDGSDSFTGAAVRSPYWVKLTRLGNAFSGYTSSNGTNWLLVGTVTISMTNRVYVGLAVTSHNNAELNTSTFDTVHLLESILAQPQSQTVNPGDSVLFSTLADGAPLYYQWQLNGVPIAGATSTSYSITNVQPTDVGNYSVVITNLAGVLVSSNATLSVSGPPFILAQPQSQTVNQGSSVTFSVTSGGSAPLSYQWQLGSVAIPDATNSSYTLPHVQSADAGDYSVVVTNELGSAVSSNATLSVNTVIIPPAITTQPASQSVNVGANVIFNVTASGTAPLDYQWRFNSNAIPGATNSTYVINGAQLSDAGAYSVVVSNSAGVATSANATLVVSSIINSGPPIITTQPQNQTVNVGANVTFNVTAGGIAPLYYQWQLNGTNLIGATSNAFSLANVQLTDAGNYAVVVTNSLGVVISSNAALVVNTPNPTNWFDTDIGSTVIPGHFSVSNGMFTIQASGDDIWGDADAFHFVYQSLSGDGAIVARILNIQNTDTWAKLGVMIRETLTAGSKHGTLFVSSQNGVSFQRRPITGGDSDATSIDGIQAPYWVKLVRSGDAFDASISSDGITWVLVDSVTIPMANNVYIGMALTSHNNGQLNTSTLDNLEFLESPTAQPQDQSVSLGGVANFAINVYGSPLYYQWQKNGVNISGATDSVYAVTNAQATDAGSYSVIVTNLAGSIVSSNAALTINDLPLIIPPSITAQPEGLIVREGDTATFNVSATGTEPLAYQWLFNNSPIADATSSSLVLSNAQSTNAGNYSVIITNAAGSTTSSVAGLTINIPPSITTQPENISVAAGTSVLLTVNATGTEPLSYQWLLNGTNIPGANSGEYSLIAAQPGDAGSYTVIITNIAGSVSSAAATLTVNTTPLLAAIPDQIVDEGTTLTITNSAVDADIPASNLTFSLGTNAPTGASIDSTNGLFTWTPTEAQGPSTNVITVIVTDDGVPALSASQSFTVIVNEVNSAPELTAIADQVVDEGTTLSVTNSAVDLDIPANNLIFSLGTNAPAGASIDPANGLFTWTPSEDQGPSTNVITVIVTDDGIPALSASQSFTVVVNEVNSAPELAAIADQIVNEGNTLNVTNSATDLDIPANNITFSLGTNAPVGASINPTNGLFTWTPTEAQGPSTNVITVIVTDDGVPALSSSQSFVVIVNEVNSAPELAAIADQVVDEGTTLFVTNSAVDVDIPANNLIFSLGTNAPAGATIDPTNGLVTWTPTEAQGPSTKVITVIVTDDGVPALSASQSFTVIVNEVNSAPVLTPIVDRVVHAETLLSFTVSATDADLPANILTFSLDTNAPTGAQINSTNGVFTWTPTDAQLGTNVFTIHVADDGLPSLSDSKIFTVQVVSKPGIQSISLQEGTVSLTWSTIPGKQYQIQYKNNLEDSDWLNLSNIVTAAGTTVSVTDQVGSANQRFYRITLVP